MHDARYIRLRLGNCTHERFQTLANAISSPAPSTALDTIGLGAKLGDEQVHCSLLAEFDRHRARGCVFDTFLMQSGPWNQWRPFLTPSLAQC